MTLYSGLVVCLAVLLTTDLPQLTGRDSPPLLIVLNRVFPELDLCRFSALCRWGKDWVKDLAQSVGGGGPGRELKGDSHQIWRTQRVQVNLASLRLFLRSSTGPNRAFEPQSLDRVRDPVRIAEGPTHDLGGIGVRPIWEASGSDRFRIFC